MSEKNSSVICSCHEDNLIVRHNQINRIIIFCVGMSILLFTLGYFVGKRKALELYIDTLEQESFSDRFQHAMLKLYTNRKTPLCFNSNNDNDEQLGQDSVDTKESLQSPLSDAENKLTYKAQLAGFSSHKTANAMVARLARHGLSSAVVRRTSSSTGKSKKNISWFQVTSDIFADKNQLEEYVETVKRLEHIRDVKIVTIN